MSTGRCGFTALLKRSNFDRKPELAPAPSGSTQTALRAPQTAAYIASRPAPPPMSSTFLIAQIYSGEDVFEVTPKILRVGIEPLFDRGIDVPLERLVGGFLLHRPASAPCAARGRDAVRTLDAAATPRRAGQQIGDRAIGGRGDVVVATDDTRRIGARGNRLRLRRFPLARPFPGRSRTDTPRSGSCGWCSRKALHTEPGCRCRR